MKFLILSAILLMSNPIQAEELVLKGEGYTLPASVVLPQKAGPCVVFFAGSGPTDRNWLSPMLPGTNGAGAQLATALAQRNIGSIRFDKVGSGKNMKKLGILSLAHYVDEARLAFAHLEKEARCHTIFIMGHSEGGLHALNIGHALKDRSKFGGVISLSGAGRTLRDVLVEQLTARAPSMGVNAETAKKTLSTFNEAIRGLPGSKTSKPDLSGMPQVAMMWQQFSVQGDVVGEILNANPAASAAAYTGRLLIVSAGRDIQVPVSDAVLLLEASKSRDKRHIEIKDANHVFKHETRDGRTMKPLDVAKSYAEDGRPLAKGLVSAIESFVNAKK